MYNIKKYENKFIIYELMDEVTHSWLKVCPERGGIIFSYGVQGKEILYLNADTFYNASKNIRGGIPILFPICGKLIGGKYNIDGKEYLMQNHGVARINPWEVIETSVEGSASIKIRLKSNEDTLKSYPFKFELIFTYILQNGCLRIEQEYVNNSKDVMPFQAGFHPYFKTIVKDISYKTDATEYLDYNDMMIKKYESKIDLENMVESAAFLNSKESSISFELPDLDCKLLLTYGEEFKYIVVWSVKDKGFICVEPWTSKNGALNTGEGLIYIKPGNNLEMFFEINIL